jgi:hypothetical protein
MLSIDMAPQGRRTTNQLHNTIWHILVPENAGGATQRRPHILHNDKVGIKDQVGRNVFSYVDDIIVASKKKPPYISDLTETFANMCEAKLKLNSDKCIFGVMRGKVLGCLVSTNGIKASPDKIKAILQKQPSQTRKEVQKLAGHIAALNRFIAKLVERSLPFFSVLRGSAKVE